MRIGYHAFIDEAGDDGLKTIRTEASNGASEWLVMSAIIVKAENESKIPDWGWDIVRGIGQHQMSQLHYVKLNRQKRLFVCQELAKLPVRIFVVLSNKKNMEGYRNLRAEKAKVNRTAWFYCWVSKLLLESVTSYCANRTFKDYGENRSVQFNFSDRGGVDIDDIRNYYNYIRWQSENNRQFDPRFDLRWDVMDTNEFKIFPNKVKIGLQLSDIAASAFFNGLELNPGRQTDPQPAKALESRIATDYLNRKFGFGIKLMPRWRAKRLHDQQRELIEYYINK